MYNTEDSFTTKTKQSEAQMAGHFAILLALFFIYVISHLDDIMLRRKQQEKLTERRMIILNITIQTFSSVFNLYIELISSLVNRISINLSLLYFL